MSSYYQYHAHAHPTAATPSASSHHSGRGRRAPRLSQNSHKQFRSVKKEEEAAAVSNFRQRFESGRSFDLDDDLEFCPNLIEDSDRDMFSINSSGSDRSSLSSGSPETSPQAHSVTPDTFSLNSNSLPYIPSYHNHTTTLKIHQPAATRNRNAIPIVNPSTGIRLPSPPNSVSPARMIQQSLGRRW